MISIMALLLLIPCFVFYFALLILFLSVDRGDPSPALEDCNASVSVVVAARNEEKNIRHCLDALSKQDYPNFEIIVVDDRSRDETAKIVTDFAGHESSLRLVRVSQNSSGLSGKQNALDAGIGAVRGEIVLCTDADCRPSPQWISRTTARMAQEKADFIFGRTRMVPGASLWHRFQALGLDLLFGIALALHRLGMPGSCMGNNIAFRRDRYLEIGGQKALGYQATEDFALMTRFRKRGFRISAIAEPIVATPAEISGITYVRQQLRWLCGGLNGTFALALLPIVLANVSFWFLPWYPMLSFVWIVLAGLGLAFALRSTTKPYRLLALPLLVLFIAISPALYILSLAKPKTIWKSDIIQTRPQT